MGWTMAGEMNHDSWGESFVGYTMADGVNHGSWSEPFVRYIMTDEVNHIWCTSRKISKGAQKSKIV